MKYMTIEELQPHQDRRQRKSRAALQQGFLQVIAVKPYEAITIEDITDAADLTRATFYAHYHDKAALTCEAYENIIEELGRQIADVPISESAAYTGEGMTIAFEHARQNANLYQIAIDGSAGVEPRRVLVEALESFVTDAFAVRAQHLGKTPRVPEALYAGCYVASFLHVVKRWLAGDLLGSPREMADIFLLIQMRGMEWASGFEPGELRYEPPTG